MILASHTDSPALKLKPHPALPEGEYDPCSASKFMERPALASWLNRDLADCGKGRGHGGSGQPKKDLSISTMRLFYPAACYPSGPGSQ